MSAVGIAATFSRGAAACFALAMVVLAARGAFRSWQLVFAGVAIVVAVLLAFQYASSHGLLNENTVARVRLAKDDSGRLDLARQAWAAFVRSPWTGEGLGFVRAGAEQPHNMLLYLAADQGFAGLLLFPALGLALVMRNRAALAFSAGFMLAGVFSHNLLEDRAMLVLVALAAAGGAAASPAPGARLTWPRRRTAPTRAEAGATARGRSTPSATPGT
jgi:O-antigen ligase